MALAVLEITESGKVRTSRSVSSLCEGLDFVRVRRGGDALVHRVRVDSRAVTPGDLFVAVPGTQDDGLRHAGDALARGACGVLTAEGAEAPGGRAWVVAPEPRLAAALLAARAWGDPSQRLSVLGITGTNGKTTTAFLVQAVWSAAGQKAAVLGTLGAALPGETIAQARTTPEAPEIQATLARAVEAGCSAAAMEVSSHALDLFRVDGTRFEAAAFLNLSAEHLDWHGSMEAYGTAKMRLFRDLLPEGRAPGGPRAVLNGNDPWADRFRSVVEGSVAFATGGGDAEVTARGIRSGKRGTSFLLVTPGGESPVELALPGIHNVENALAAASLAHVMGIGTDVIARGLSAAEAPPGRFERVHDGSFSAYVDYAHTEQGVRLALVAARELTRGKLVVVLGCGGERDRAKRPAIGKAAAELADLAVFTTDNPRGEDPAAIVQEMLSSGAAESGRVEVVLDREEALALAVERCEPGDLVLALGKGHETVQAMDGEQIPFPEREILARLSARRDGRST